MKEFSFQLDDGVKTAPICCSWLFTDSNLFVVGFESSHAVFYDYKTGSVEHSKKIDEADSSPIACIAPNTFNPHVALGH